jgi:hypothetical protein
MCTQHSTPIHCNLLTTPTPFIYIIIIIICLGRHGVRNSHSFRKVGALKLT